MADASKKKLNNTVIVVGGGLAGMSAAIEAHRAGAEVILLEKNARLGGNSALASSGINLINTQAQKEFKVNDSFDTFMQDTLKAANFSNSKLLVSVLVNESPEAATFLSELGVDISLVTQCGAHSVARTHRAKQDPNGKLENVGFHITSRLAKLVESLHPKLRVVYSAQVENLIQNKDGTVVGVHYTTAVENKSEAVDLLGDVVVLATGGYSADKLLLGEFCPKEISELATTNGPWARGEGVKMARKIGAELIDMDKVQIHPTGIIDPKDIFNLKKFLAPEAFRGCGAIILNHKGERFVNELGGRDYVTNEIFKSCAPLSVPKEGLKEDQRVPTVGYLIMNDQVAKDFDLKIFDFYKSKGLISTYKNAKEMADYLKVSEDTIRNTLKEYNTYVEKSKNGAPEKDKYGKSLFPVSFNPDETLYIVLITPSLHYTMGGIRMSDQAEALKKDNTPISGLYVCGEVSGGVHGNNRLAGNSLLECVVFGRRAGKNAASYRLGEGKPAYTVKTKPAFTDTQGVFHDVALHPDTWVPCRLSTRVQLNSSTHYFSFALPNKTDQMGLLAGQYIAVRALLDGKYVERFYSPVNRNSDFGKIDLIVKLEEVKMNVASMTRYFSLLQPGNTLEIRGPLGGFEYHRNMYKEVGMIAGGTGISPMMQIIRSIVHHPEDKTNIKLLYGNYVEDDILAKEELMYYSSTRNNIKSYMTLVTPPPHWTMGTGFITEDMIKNFLPKPSADIRIVLCGPPGMIKVMLPILKKLEYTEEMIFSFI